ncbi:MAG: hypothetical protein KH356_30715, partial [Lachnospiraceae bacterium]|nr:hypothetical protein [Lachnospiraceae bacterium]
IILRQSLQDCFVTAIFVHRRSSLSFTQKEDTPFLLPAYFVVSKEFMHKTCIRYRPAVDSLLRHGSESFRKSDGLNSLPV